MSVGILDALIIFGIIFGFVLGTQFLFFSLDSFSTSLGNSVITDLVTSMKTGWGYGDYTVVILVVIIFVLGFFTGFFKSSNPLTLFLTVLFYLFGVILAVNVQTIFDAYLQTPTILTTYLSALPLTLIIMQNVVITYILMGSGYFIGLYSKRTVIA